MAISRPDALALTLLTAELEDDRWPRAAARWLGRFILESPAITIGEVGIAAAAVRELDVRIAGWPLKHSCNLCHVTVTRRSLHSWNPGGERPWQQIADLFEWIKRSPGATPIPPLLTGAQGCRNLVPGAPICNLSSRPPLFPSFGK